MKKILCSLVAFVALMIGCGGNNGITDNMVKNYELSLNEGLDEVKENLADEFYSISLNFPDFKCKKEEQKIVCQAFDIAVLIDEQEILSIKNIIFKTNQIYTGDKKGEISISEAYENIAKKGISDELIINGFKLSDTSKGLIALAFMQSKELAFLSTLADGEYDIVLANKYNLKDEILSGDTTFSINNASKGIKIDAILKNDIDYKLLANTIDKYKLATFDVNFQSIKQLNEFFDSMGYGEGAQISSDILKSFILEKLNVDVSLQDLYDFYAGIDYVKSGLKYDMQHGKYVEPSKKLLEVIDRFEKSNPHLFSIVLSRAQGISIFDIDRASSWGASSEDKAKLQEGVSLKINDIDFTKFLIN